MVLLTRGQTVTFGDHIDFCECDTIVTFAYEKEEEKRLKLLHYKFLIEVFWCRADGSSIRSEVIGYAVFYNP